MKKEKQLNQLTRLKRNKILKRLGIPKSLKKIEKLSLEQKEVIYTKLSNLISEYDITSPPGLAGDICKDLALHERRPIPELRPLVPLAIFSMLSKNRRNVDEEKMTLFAMCTAHTSSGKETHMTYIKKVLGGCGQSGNIVGKPRSDKAIILDLLENEYLLYLMDEGHDVFNKALNKGSGSSFETGIGELLLELKTTSLYHVPGNLVREQKQRLQSRADTVNSKANLTKNDHKELEFIERVLKYLESGWPDPHVTLVSYSNPISNDSIISMNNILTGFIGRFLMLRSGDLRKKFVRVPRNSVVDDSIIKRCNDICMGKENILLSRDSECLLELITDFFERDEYLNHDQLGGIYARGVQQIKQISSLLAVETGEITVEDLLYSMSVFMSSVKWCEEVLMKQLNSSWVEILDICEAKIRRATVSGSMMLGTIANSLVKCNAEIRKKRSTQDKYEYKVIEALEKRGSIIIKDKTVCHRSNLPK
jgi:hypothetical protein